MSVYFYFDKNHKFHVVYVVCKNQNKKKNSHTSRTSQCCSYNLSGRRHFDILCLNINTIFFQKRGECR